MTCTETPGKAASDTTLSNWTAIAAAGSSRHRDPVEIERRVESLLDAFGDHRHVRMIGDVLHENRKFVSAKTRDRVGGADTRVQPASYGNQQLIPDNVPEAIVDRFELVDIHKQHRD